VVEILCEERDADRALVQCVANEVFGAVGRRSTGDRARALQPYL
jgi:hypothetical protein